MSDASRFKKIKNFARRHPVAMSLLFSALAGIALTLIQPLHLLSLVSTPSALLVEIPFVLLVGILCGGFLVYPIVLTGVEFYLLFRLRPENPGLYSRSRVFDLITLSLGVLFSPLYLNVFHNTVFNSHWTETLSNAQTHSPVYTLDVPTMLVICFVGVVGYLTVSCIPLAKMPPLVLVSGMSAMYLGTAESTLWGYQVCTEIPSDFILLLLPLNCILITARTVIYKMQEWNSLPMETHKIDSVPLLGWCNRVLKNVRLWPVAAFLLMWPLLGILICVLLLFGQSPDSVIRIWTETSDWNLSRRTAPQNIYYDEHYLCTVAAGGHRKIVKPLRLGRRHGHEVIVNRQLCVANAFEQVLEEKLPRFHRIVRNFYDKYGFPVARLIRSPYTADMIYFLMKPLEWFFLAVLYFTDVRPEDRIAVQYTK